MYTKTNTTIKILSLIFALLFVLTLSACLGDISIGGRNTNVDDAVAQPDEIDIIKTTTEGTTQTTTTEQTATEAETATESTTQATTTEQATITEQTTTTMADTTTTEATTTEATTTAATTTTATMNTTTAETTTTEVTTVPTTTIATTTMSTRQQDMAPLTYDEAFDMCNEWLNENMALDSYAAIKWFEEDFEEIPPTFSLFGQDYFEICVSYAFDESYDNGYTHYFLVHERTGEIISFYRSFTNGVYQIATLESLSQWYYGVREPYAPVLLTMEEAISIYDTWLENRFDDSEDISYYRLNNQTKNKFEIFGEQYYYFYAEIDYYYWYSVLINMRTGELLIFMTGDGLLSETIIEPLDDWFNRAW